VTTVFDRAIGINLSAMALRNHNDLEWSNRSANSCRKDLLGPACLRNAISIRKSFHSRRSEFGSSTSSAGGHEYQLYSLQPCLFDRGTRIILTLAVWALGPHSVVDTNINAMSSLLCQLSSRPKFLFRSVLVLRIRRAIRQGQGTF